METVNKEALLAYLRAIKDELEKDGIARIGLFGSMAKGEADGWSDIDIVIQTTPEFVRRFGGIRGFLYLEDLRQRLARRFGRPVDLCDETGLKDRRVLRGVVYV